MSAQQKRTMHVARQVARLAARERSETNRLKRCAFWAARWMMMLFHEVLRDNVKMRAESLAYLSLFSLLPLLAGCFFVFSVLAQFGMVQDALNGLLGTFLNSIPFEHREFVAEYVTKFQQNYLQTLQQKSGTIGIFAIFILAYVGLGTFSNIDQTLNDIWGADSYRPFFEKARNFIVVAVVAPVLLTAGFSIPLILRKIPVTEFVLKEIPALNLLLAYLIPTGLLFGTFYVLYRYVPVVRVRWKAAFYGALFATFAFEITHILLRMYFSFFTHTAYGKLAAIPLIAFWLFVVWILIILGAEVSFLVENQADIIARSEGSPTFAEARGLVSVLTHLNRRFQAGKGPAEWSALLSCSGVSAESLRRLLEWLESKGWANEVHADKPTTDSRLYLPGRDLSTLSVATVLADYLAHATPSDKLPWSKHWAAGIQSWLESFGEKTIEDLG